MDVDRAFLDDVKHFAPIAFVKKIIAFVEILLNGERSDPGDVSRRQTHEELATAERILNNRLPERDCFQRHDWKLSPQPLIVPPKMRDPRGVLTLNAGLKTFTTQLFN